MAAAAAGNYQCMQLVMDQDLFKQQQIRLQLTSNIENDVEHEANLEVIGLQDNGGRSALMRACESCSPKCA